MRTFEPVASRDEALFYADAGLVQRLGIHAGCGSLMAAETHPQFRRRGVQQALLQARLVAAVQAGCDLATVQRPPGTGSQRNVLRAGFGLMYTAVRFMQPGPQKAAQASNG